MKASKVIWDLALKAHSEGEVFPIWGTCLGFEQIGILGSESNTSVITKGFDSEDFPAPVSFTRHALSSEIMEGMPERLLHAMESKNITYNSHGQGFDPIMFSTNQELVGFFDVVATAVDAKGRPFVAMIEARKNIPIYAVQFHPEKAIFEWHLPTKIPHQPEAISIAHYFADFFVEKSRCSSHSFGLSASDENRELVQFKTSQHSYNPDGYFMETYKF